MALPAEKERYTYADYLSWDNDVEQFEIIDGEAILMAPGASNTHQGISVSIASQLYAYLKGKSCVVRTAPFDVRLFEREEDSPEDVNTVVQPDIMVICDKSKIDERGCKGAPDMVIEILSASSQRHDRIVKFQLYEQAGVKEYWLVDPANKTAQSFVLESGRYVVKELGVVGDKMKVNVLESCLIDLTEVFPES